MASLLGGALPYQSAHLSKEVKDEFVRKAFQIWEGSRNVFADLDLPNPEERLAKAESRSSNSHYYSRQPPHPSQCSPGSQT